MRPNPLEATIEIEKEEDLESCIRAHFEGIMNLLIEGLKEEKMEKVDVVLHIVNGQHG